MAQDGQDRRYRLHGWAAIEHAEAHGGSLSAYREDGQDPERSSEAISTGRAKELAQDDPKLVFLDTDLCESCLAGGHHRPATTHRDDPDLPGYALCSGCAGAEDAPPPPPA